MAASSLPAPFDSLIKRQPLWWAIIAGVGMALALVFLGGSMTPLSRGLLAWDTAIAVNLAVLLAKSRHASAAHLEAHADETDEGRHFVLFASLVAVAVSVAAVVMETAETNATHGGLKALQVAFVFATVVLSWVFVHASFASHYVHEYYGFDEGAEKPRGGLAFPGDEKPDYWDFWHFAFVIGVANQTADVCITSKAIRRVVTLHGVTAFFFNTIILALTINFAAGLFS